MRHQRVVWGHDHPDEPVVLYSEVADDGTEVRKVDVFADGRMARAGPSEESGTTRLSEARIPSIDDINASADFVAETISASEFEELWRRTERPK